MTIYEIAGRNKKAAALVAVLREAGVSASVAKSADDHDWEIAYQKAGVKPSNPETKHLTRALVIERLETLCRCDAFGLPACVLDLEEPPCECGGPDECEVHGAGSKYRKALLDHDVKPPVGVGPRPIVWSEENEECPF